MRNFDELSKYASDTMKDKLKHTDIDEWVSRYFKPIPEKFNPIEGRYVYELINVIDDFQHGKIGKEKALEEREKLRKDYERAVE
jgi:hypothetical protein